MERSLTYVAPELARRGHEITVIGGDPAAMEPLLSGSGVRFVPATSVGAAIRALVEHRRAEIDIVHSHMTAADIASVSARPRVGAPLVSTLHFAQPRGHTRVRREVYRPLDRCFRRQIAISRYVAETCASPAVVVPNGVPEPPYRAGTRERVVLVAQRLEQEKDTDLALEAWSRASLRSQGWRLAIAGRGVQASRLRELARVRGLNDTVDFLGFVPDVGAHMARASMLLATAPGEPFGLAVVEAMASGLPVLAANGGAHREVLEGFADQLFPVADPVACATALDAFADDGRLRTDAAARGRARYEDRYTIARHVDRLLDVYAEARR